MTPSNGLPWPVVILLTAVTLAALYGVSLLAARWHRPPPEPSPGAVPARTVPAPARDRHPYDDGGILGFSRREPGEDEL